MSTFPSHDWCAQESLIIPWSMCVKRPAVCVTVMLLFTVAHSKRSCDYSEIISTYRALILVELQNLNLTGPFDISKEKDHCPSEKFRPILRSIYGMTQIFSCLTDNRRQKRSDGMTEVVTKMSALTKDCLKPQTLAKKKCKKVKKRSRRQQRRLKLMGMIINCWQRLLSVKKPHTDLSSASAHTI